MFILPFVITALGGFLLIKLRFFPILHPRRVARGMLRAVGEQGGYSSLALALAGTLGVGNIFGVAIAISIGGAGSVFWLFLSGIFAAVIKYAEATVCTDLSQNKGQGGMMYAIRQRLRRGGALGALYATLCIALSFVMGGAMQSSAAVSAAALTIGHGPIFPILFVSLTFAFVIGKKERIKSVTATLVPLAAVIYISSAMIVIIKNASLLPDIISDILRSAFTPTAAGGGLIGSLVVSPMVRGFATGILSNEAGAGTSSMAHTSGSSTSPAGAGLLAMCEVIFDTVILCMLTAFAILLSVREPLGTSTASLVVEALSAAYSGGGIMLTVSVFAFALATAVCWYFYGRVALGYFTRRGGVAFLALYLLFVGFGSLFDCSGFAAIADVILLALTLLTTPVIIKSSDRVRALSELDGLI